MLYLAHLPHNADSKQCFFGNIPAAIGHTNEAFHYFQRMQSDDNHKWDSILSPIAHALANLRQTCHVVLPVLSLGLVDANVLPLLAPPTFNLLSPSSVSVSLGSSASLRDLLDFAGAYPDVNDLIWNPWMIYERVVPPNRISLFQSQLSNWAAVNGVFSQFDSQLLKNPVMECDWEDVNVLALPPPPFFGKLSPLGLIAAIYSFFMARTLWALSLFDHDIQNEQNYLLAYCYTYEAMRSVATIVANGERVNDMGEGYVACETLGNGLVPMLHILGQCCPRPAWLQWIMEQMTTLKQEGLFNGVVLAKSLNALYTFEVSNNIDSSSLLDRFPQPTARVISVIIPGLDGQSFICFYASPDSRDPLHDTGARPYYPIGHAQWSEVRRGGSTKPVIDMYNEQRRFSQPFTKSWILEQQVAHDWLNWSTSLGVGFNLDRALRDHINGSCLENAIYQQPSNAC